ncbi:unnamed protein product [Urochloa humidicola]
MQLTSRIKATSSSSHTAADNDARRGGGPADLPLHLTEKILYGISPLAAARLATVCKSWAAIVSDRLKKLAPHLFVYLPVDHRFFDRRGVVVSVSLADGDTSGHPPPPAAIPCRVRLRDTNDLRCVGAMAASGRLAFANYSWCLLVNPITGARRWVDVGKLRGNPVVPSGGAGGAADSFVPIAIDELVLWRRLRRRAAGGGKEEWSGSAVQDGACRTDAIMSVASCNNGRFLYMLDPVRVTEYGYLLGSDDGEAVLFVRRVVGYNSVPGVAAAARCRHDADEVLYVVGFEVYRLDADGGGWTEVEELAGDRALFVSPASSFAVRASETEGCRCNRIYFVDRRRHCYSCHKDDGIAWGVYSMEHREISFRHTIGEPGPCTSATWFLPRVP